MRFDLLCTKGGVGRVLATLVLAFSVTTIAHAQCPGEGNCCEDNGSIGCDDIDCCTLVCGADPFCCAETWDQVCADQAADLCSDLCGGGGGPCGEGAGDCCDPAGNGTPGCDDIECCEQICAADPFCCDTSWDGICAGAAAAECAVCQAPQLCPPDADGCCYAANGTPGCNDPACCETVCGIDPFCCDIEWDGTCAAQAVDACFSTTCEGNTNGDLAVDVEDLVNVILAWDSTEFCGTGPDVSPNGIIDVEDLVVVILNWGSCPACTACGIEGTPEGEECGTDTNGGCNSDPAAFGSIAFDETVCGDGWADGGTRDTDWYLFSHEGGPVTATLTSEFNGVVFLVDGIAACVPVVVGATGASNGCEPLGSAVADLPAGEYVVFVAPADFEGAPCGGGNNAYSVTLIAGGEPPVICGEGAGDCFIPNGTPGCEDVDCCEAVCAADPFCCDTEWDAICADAAAVTCATDPEACCFGDGTCEDLLPAECLGAGGTPQGPGTLCKGVNCIAICGEGAGDCFIDNGTPGCEDVDCCQAVCAIDPFCCDVAWDGICAEQALVTCATDPQACCFFDGSCEDLLPADCIGAGGVPQGSGSSCANVECPVPCDVPCEGGTDEGEDCGADTNGGCNADPVAFGSISCGETVCGTGWADGGTRDTDWFLFSHEGGLIQAELVSAFNGVVFIVSGIDTCLPVVEGQAGSSNDCEPLASAEAVLPAGDYVIFVAAADFEGAPCGTDNSYRVTLTCGGELGTGACCITGFCEDGLTSVDCAGIGGVYQGDDTICDGIDCTSNAACPGAGDCCDPAGNGSPGCDDEDCCNIICLADPFCCDTSWDGICAGAAAAECEICIPNPGAVNVDRAERLFGNSID